jgi:ribose transport system substrate-binding protein
MQTRRRIAIAIALAAGMTLGLAGCGQDKATSKPKVAMVITDSKLDFAKEMGDGFAAGSKEDGGVDATVVGLDIRGGPTQLARFQELTKKAKDGVAVETLAPELFAKPLAAAAKDGVPLIAVDAPPEPGSGVRLYVGNDNYGLGVKLADEAIKRLPPKATGKVLLGTPKPGFPPLDLRIKGLQDEFAKRLPSVRVLGPFDVLQDERANEAAWQRLVTANPDALAFLGTGAADSFNLAAIRKRTGGKWLAAAFDVEPQSLAAVKQGQLFALMSPEHFLNGSIAGHLIARDAKGEHALPQGWFATPGLAITSANIDQIIKRQASSAAREDWFRAKAAALLKNQKSYLRPLAGIR